MDTGAAKPKAHSRVKIDLTGQRFGRLVVLEPAPNIGSRTAWRCLCDCGQERVVKTVNLRDGRTTSCGCASVPLIQHLTMVGGTCVEMLRGNETPRCNNTSGVVGVEWMKRARRWRATLCFQGKRHYLGRYERFEDAVAARKRAEAELIEPFLAQYPEKGTGR